jgi:multidrug efflux pump subunit AcrB
MKTRTGISVFVLLGIFLVACFGVNFSLGPDHDRAAVAGEPGGTGRSDADAAAQLWAQRHTDLAMQRERVFSEVRGLRDRSKELRGRAEAHLGRAAELSRQGRQNEALQEEQEALELESRANDLDSKSRELLHEVHAERQRLQDQERIESCEAQLSEQGMQSEARALRQKAENLFQEAEKDKELAASMKEQGDERNALANRNSAKRLEIQARQTVAEMRRTLHESSAASR